jgi:hypothetical protein
VAVEGVDLAAAGEAAESQALEAAKTVMVMATI